ncbi:MAG: GNAT family N-acetyltransferase [Planctomycetaceae bacterium]|nr:GNAT family N-acetyltransferase [Planctomycetaceae bacterium]
MNIDIQTHHGESLAAEIGKLSEFRLRYFREYPYLYAGMEEHVQKYDAEQKYIARYIADPTARLILVRDMDADGEIVGIAIGTMLSYEQEILRQASEQLYRYGIVPEQFFYFGEMIFVPEYRNKGLGRQTLKTLKNAGKEQGCSRFCFLAVDREPNDVRRPVGYVDSEMIFQKFGFEKTDIAVSFDWPTVQADGSVKTVANRLAFWVDR